MGARMLLKRLVLSVSFALAAAGCATEAPLPDGNASYSIGEGVSYALGPGDKLRIVVFNDPAMSGEFLIGNNGNVAMPLVGDVTAGGLTLETFQIAVRDGITRSGMVRDPKVSVDVVEYRPFYILGEVNNPGKYPYTAGLTVTKAVATAGGFTYRADGKTAYVTREGKALEKAEPVTAATWIGPGDTVRIAERHF